MRRMETVEMNGHLGESVQLTPIEVEDPLTTSIGDLIREVKPLFRHCCIFRVPDKFRRRNEKAFDPVMVSIGPLHHGKQHLQSMERIKVAYLDAFLRRAKVPLETFIKEIRKCENDVRNCYAETIRFNSEDFVKMILLDSCFIIEVMERNACIDSVEEEHTDHLSRLMMISDVRRRDMILLENQLPFFVLERLYNLAFPDTKSTLGFIEFCLGYLFPCLLIKNIKLAMSNIKRQRQQSLEIKHLLDLVRVCQAPSIPRQGSHGPRQERSMRKATKLEEAGMIIKPSEVYGSAAEQQSIPEKMLSYSVIDIRYRKGVSQIPEQQSRPEKKLSYSAVDIHYEKGVLQIPKLQSIPGKTLRNLMALERGLYRDDSYISDYVYFMDSLIDTSHDVDVLVRKGIIDTDIESDGVAKLLNDLKPRHLVHNYLYYGMQEAINGYCKERWHKWRANLVRDYFSTPWIIASTTAAILLLTLTFIQTVCSVISSV